MKLEKLFFIPLVVISITSLGQSVKSPADTGKKKPSMNTMSKTMENKMKVEIWSDVMCPFCYIGKRQLEQALARFDHKDQVEIIWHSFQLNPNLTYQPGKDLYSYVAELKGKSREWSIQVHQGLVEMAKSVGLDYRFDKAKITNSFDALRVIHLAEKHQLTNEIEERFFRAYFTEGALMSDHETLVRLAGEVGLNRDEVWTVLNSNLYADDVRKDREDAKLAGATGVPFFVINKKDAMIGEQNPDVMLDQLNKSFADWKKDHPENKLKIINGKSCTPGGDCY